METVNNLPHKTQSIPGIAAVRMEKFIGARTLAMGGFVQIPLTPERYVSESIVVHACLINGLSLQSRIQLQVHVSQTTEIQAYELGECNAANVTRAIRYAMPGLDSVDNSSARSQKKGGHQICSR
jgi:hypothetical protein